MLGGQQEAVGFGEHVQRPADIQRLHAGKNDDSDGFHGKSLAGGTAVDAQNATLADRQGCGMASRTRLA
ncbi:hypothetical protein G6F68_021865 [Rhizopus microsporus]|nr:hypothetical protein G6F68_021865 [Rhizopus microsporus]